MQALWRNTCGCRVEGLERGCTRWNADGLQFGLTEVRKDILKAMVVVWIGMQN